jgi:xanthine dehydrogenase accessory factor
MADKPPYPPLFSSGPQLVLVGPEKVARTLARLGRLMNFTVTLVDPFLTPDQVPGAHRVLNVLNLSQLVAPDDTYIVIASGGRFDEEAVEQALGTPAAYVALVANRKRGEGIRRSLEARGLDPQELSRLRSPAGLDLGAEGPEEVALSVMAEIIAERRRMRRSSSR